MTNTITMRMEWVEVRGGTCWDGDKGRPVEVPTLLWTRTPITCGQLDPDPPDMSALPPVSAALPFTHIDRANAEALAGCLGGRLPTSLEWQWMAAGAERRRWPWGNAEWRPQLANLRGSGLGRVTPVEAHPAGSTPEGVLDVAGNVWEWTATSTTGGGAVLRGGSYDSPPSDARCTSVRTASAELRSADIGFRVVRES